MSLSAAAIRLLAAKGLSAADIADVAEANETPCAAQKPRTAAAERQAKYRAKRNGDVTRDATPTITRDVTVTSQSVTSDASSCAREENITSNSVDRLNLTTLQRTDERTDMGAIDWPESDPPSRAYLDRLEAALREAAGPGLAAIAPNLMVLAPILALGRVGKDGAPPCDLNADVLAVIRARGARARPNSISQWGYFTEAIREARDRRLAGAPAAQEIQNHGRGGRDVRTDYPDRKQAAYLDRLSDIDRAMAAACE